MRLPWSTTLPYALFLVVCLVLVSLLGTQPVQAGDDGEQPSPNSAASQDNEVKVRTPENSAIPGAPGQRRRSGSDMTLVGGEPGDGKSLQINVRNMEDFQKRMEELQKAQQQFTSEYQKAMKELQDQLPRSVQIDIKRQEAKQKMDAAQAEMTALGIAQSQAMGPLMVRDMGAPLPENAAIGAFTLKYVRPEDIGQALHNITGGGGPRIAVDERTNTLLIAGNPKQMDVAQQLVKTLDQPGKLQQDEMPESVQLRIVWLSEGLSDRDMEPPKPSIVSPQVADALRELGMEQPQVVCQQLISLTLNRPDHRAPFHFRVPTDIEDSTWEFQGDGAIVPTANDRYALDFKLALTHSDPKSPQLSEVSGSILTPLGHYTVMGTTTFVAAAHGSDTGKAQRLSAFVVYVDRPKDFSHGDSSGASSKKSGDKSQ
jgi:hypothetical protein